MGLSTVSVLYGNFPTTCLYNPYQITYILESRVGVCHEILGLCRLVGFFFCLGGGGASDLPLTCLSCLFLPLDK